MLNIRQFINLYFYRPKIPFINTSLEEYVTFLREGTFFSFSRFGDGEWAAIFGSEGANCDGHEFFYAMTEKLRDAVIHPSGSYYMGMQNYAVKQMGRKIYRFLKINGVRICWRQADVFHYANLAGKLYPFIEVLRTKRVILIGPPYLRKIDKALVKYDQFIEVPQHNCFRANEVTREAVLRLASAQSGSVYAFSASMATNCLIHDLFPEIGSTCWMLDLGSLWDGYSNVMTRTFCSRYDWKELLKINSTPS